MRRLIVALSLAAALSAPSQTIAQPQADEPGLNEKAKEMVRRELKDPNSAEFRDIYQVSLPKGGTKVCGWVNSKNSFGGYVGFRRFISDGTDGFTSMEGDSPLFGHVMPFSELWTAFCKK